MKAFIIPTLIASLASFAAAQERPFVYLTHAPAYPIAGSTLEGHAAQMVHVKFADSPDSAKPLARQAKTNYADQLALGNTDPEHVCIWVQNFGAPTEQHPTHASCFFQPEDVLNPQPIWASQPNAAMPYTQPWLLTYGIPRAREWMTAFLDEYQSSNGGLPPGPRPARFHFDVEIGLPGCCDINYVRILDAMAQDTLRWSSYPVPGSGAPGSEQTMAQLYDEARGQYGWPSSIRDINDGLNLAAPVSQSRNRKFFIWYERIAQAAINSAMFHAAYGGDGLHNLIRDRWPATLTWPGCKVSNYQFNTTDGLEDDFGWYTGINPANGVREAVRHGIHGAIDSFSVEGDRGVWGDLVEPSGNRSLWHVPVGITSGDFSAPELYPCHPSFYDNGSVFWPHYNYYLRPLPAGNNALSAADASLFIQRRTIESILNSAGGSPDKIAPYVAGLSVAPGQDPNHPVDAAELINQLAMLRAKGISEILVWCEVTQDWPTLQQILNRVYVPQLSSYSILVGVQPCCPPPVPDLLRYTLRNGGIPQEQVEVGAACSGSRGPQVALKVTFNNLTTLPGLMKLNLECSVSKQPPGGSMGSLRGLVFVWNPSGWVRQASTDDFGPLDPGFGFFAPEGPPGWFETRRSFDQISPYIKPDGSMDVKIVRISPPNSSCFDARFDLVQLIGKPDETTAAASGPVQGADFDYSGTVTAIDLNSFFGDWAASKAAADFNNDGVIDMNDLIAYLAAFPH